MKWIKENDDLPEEEGLYLTYANGVVYLGDYYPDMKRFGLSRTTHWMELPESPKD